jgi:uncharacterized protein YdeI (YjbR/CyaY-like superfamily)
MPTDPRVDEYIADAEPFARPILKALRAAVHAASKDVAETLKWNVPAYLQKGMVCMTPAFKAHARVVFWKAALLKSGGDAAAAETLVRLSRLESAKELPTKREIVALVRAAVTLNERGVKVPRPSKVPKPPVPVPADLLKALKRSPKAHAAFRHSAPSHQREYVEWIDAARKAETRARRIAQAVEQLRAGKSLHAKYAR